MDVTKIAQWSEGKEVQTKNGPRILHKGVPDNGFWAAWRSGKEELKAAGVSCSRKDDGTWEALWWEPLSVEIKTERKAAVEASHAASANEDYPHPDGYNYRPFQVAAIKYALDIFARSKPGVKCGVLFGDEPGLGKCHPTTTNVLTPTGWKQIGDLAVGDAVIGSNGQAVNVTGVYPQGIKAIYAVTMSDGTSVEAGLEHLWTVRYRRGGRIWADMVLTTEQLLQQPIANGVDLAKTSLYLPMLTGPVQFAANVNLPIDPYTLGQMIANGSLANGTPTITSNADDAAEVRANIEHNGAACGATQTYHNATRTTIPGSKGAVRSLKLDTLSRHKFIPPLYLLATPEQRIALLHGLMDGDGAVSATRNRVMYHTTSAQLAKDVQELVEGLGGIASIRHYKRPNKPDEYPVRIRLPHGILPFTVERKASHYTPGRNARPCRTIVSVTYTRDAEAVCIAVDAPDRLYVTEHCVLTHNTVEAIGVINAMPDIQTALIVCPKSLKLNWQRELERWLVRPMTMAVANGTWPATDIVITNYEGATKYAADIAKRQWDVFVLDEAHAIKNSKTLRSQSIKGNKDHPGVNARYHLRLTGTPIVNRPMELYNVIEDLTPGYWGSWFTFAKRYCGATHTEYGWNFSGATNLDELQVRLRQTSMVRRLKDQVLKELPRKIRQIIEFELETSDQRKAIAAETAYEAQSESRLAQLRAAVELSKAESEEAYRDAVDNLTEASKVDFTEMARLRHETALAKVPTVIGHIKAGLEDNSDKVVIGAHHHDVIEQILEGLKEFNPVVLTGKNSEQERQNAVDRFQTDPTCRVFVGGIKAAGMGITLTAAAWAVFAEIDWVPGVVSQFEDRIHRIGQLATVLIQHLVLAGSLDVRMTKTIVEKQTVIDSALDDSHPDRDAVAYTPKTQAATAALKPDMLAKIAKTLTEAQITAIHAALRMLAGMDADFASAKNDRGFNKVDSAIGHSLASQFSLTPKQAALGQRLALKYHRQLPEELLAAIKGA